MKNDGRFTRERLLGNSYAKGNTPNKTSFKEDQFVGETHYCWKGGVRPNKNDCTYVYAGKYKRLRRPRCVYEEVHGKLGSDYVIFHKDGNKDNDDIGNLEAITRAELINRNRKS
jgi:hypothetical protein